MTRRECAGTPALLMLALAGASLIQASDGAENAARPAMQAVAAGAGIGGGAAGDVQTGRRLGPRRSADRAPRRSDSVMTSAFTTVQAVACDTNWDCGSALACDPFTECDVDLYACVISQKTGQGECVFQGTCDACVESPGDLP